MRAMQAMEDEATFSVAVVEPNNRARTRLLRLLKQDIDVDAFASIDALEEEVDLNAPWIAVFGPSYADQSGIKEVQLLAEEHPTVGTVLVTEDLSTELLQQALRAHIGDVLPGPREANELLESIARVSEALGGSPLAAPRSHGEELGRLITVVSTKGGAGKSVVASNLAAWLARQSDKQVVLVDADLQFGDAAIMLNLAPRHTIVDVMSVIRRLEPGVLKDLLLHHEPTGLLVLAAPVEPAFADQVAASDLMRIVNTLRRFSGYVVVDTAPQLNDVVLGLLEECDDIVLVCPPELPSVKNATLALQTLRLLNIPLSKVRLVLNRAQKKATLDPQAVERELQLKAQVEIAADEAVPQSVNQGIPAVLGAPRSRASKGFRKLAELVLAGDPRT